MIHWPKTLLPLLLVAVLMAPPDTLRAQTYPPKLVRVVVSSPGGGTDIVARLVSEGISRSLGVQFIVESRQPNVAAAGYVARAPADGSVLLVTTASYLVNPLLRQTQYDPIRDFAPISVLGMTPIIIVVHPALPVASLKELVALARRRPGELSFASGGVGSPLHLAGELFNQATRVSIVHIPFKGTAHALTDLLAGRVQVMYPSIISLQSQIKAGKVKVLAIMNERRSAELPAVPTTSEAGLPGLLANIWYAMLAPANTPTAIVDRLNKEATAALRNPLAAERLSSAGVDIIASSPEQHSAFAAKEFAKWKQVVANARIDMGS